MLINTVLLFIQSVLPMFIIISLLLLRFTTKSTSLVTYKNMIIMLGLTFTFVFALNRYMENLSQLFDGKGTEIFFSFGYILIYLCSALLFLLDNDHKINNAKKALAFVVFLLGFSLNGSHFILYLTGFGAQSSLLESAGIESLVVGIILAMGICSSVAILLYFSLRYSDSNIHIKISCYFLLFFSLGQLMQSITLLQQVDVLPLNYSFWNSTQFIAENSELGQLFRVLFGYEARPSFMQLIIYVIAFFIPVLISKNRYFIRLSTGEKL